MQLTMQGDLPSLALIGHSGVGKSTLAGAISASTGLPAVEIGYIVRSEAARLGRLPLWLANDTFTDRQFGRFVVPAAVRLQSMDCRSCIFVGARRPEEIAILRRSVDALLVVRLCAPEAVRRERRFDIAASLDPSHLTTRDEVEHSWGVEKISSDLLLDGTLPVSDLVPLVVTTMADLIRENASNLSALVHSS